MPSYCCSSSDFLLSHYTVLLSIFFKSLFHAPLDVVHFLVFLRFFRFKSFLSQFSHFVAEIKNFCNVPGCCGFLFVCLFVFCWRCLPTSNHTILDRSPPRSTRTAPSAVHQDGGVKYATGASSKIRGRNNITIGTWNTRTLRAAGKLQELSNGMDRYRWKILGLWNELEELWRNNNRQK